MNPLIRNYLKQIEGSVDALREILREGHEELERQKEAREELVQKFWGRGKEISVLNKGRDEYEALQSQNQRLGEKQRALQERLQRVLAHTKALSSEFRP